MAVDLSVFGNIKTKADYDRQAAEFDLRKQLTQSQIAKSQEVDADKLGEQAFLKAAQGLPLTPQEAAAAKFVDAKSGGVMFNPVTGTVTQKPRISDKIGIDGLQPSNGQGPTNPNAVAQGVAQIDLSSLSAPPTAGAQPTPPPPANEFERNYQTQLAAAAGNPKLQQEIMGKYAKDKITYNEGQGKAASYADRMTSANTALDMGSGEANTMANQLLSHIPLVGNYLVPDKFQEFDRAATDFQNAQLRQESGASISPTEFLGARKQYIPAPGDSEVLLAAKKKARETALAGMTREAGPAYQPPAPRPTKVDPKKIPMAAVQELRSDPSDKAAAEFDQTFGRGAAKMVLGK